MSASTSSHDDVVGEVVYSRSAGIGNCAEDWDDTLLVEAYDAALGGIHDQLDKRSGRQNKQKTSSRAGSSSQSTSKWTVGQFCRAQYTVDKQWYEAKIIAIDGAHCIVKYLGYMNHERQALCNLQTSAGREQRQFQIKCVETEEEGESGQSSDEQDQAANVESDNASEKSSRKKQEKPLDKQTLSNQATDLEMKPQHHQQQQQGKFQSFPTKQTKDSSRKRGANEPSSSSPSMFAFPPPPPPFPPGVDEICAGDEALAAMLISWYISGYHTGYYSARRHLDK